MISLATSRSIVATTRKLDNLDQAIHLTRGHRIMLDSDLAAIYGLTTKRLDEQLKRNRARFPEDFAFQLTAEERKNLRSQIATSSLHGGRRYRPWVFTEHGAVMFGRARSPSAPKRTARRSVRTTKPKREIGFHVRETAARYRIRRR